MLSLELKYMIFIIITLNNFKNIMLSLELIILLTPPLHCCVFQKHYVKFRTYIIFTSLQFIYYFKNIMLSLELLCHFFYLTSYLLFQKHYVKFRTVLMRTIDRLKGISFQKHYVKFRTETGFDPLTQYD